MLGLAVLFGLGLWIAATLFAMKIGGQMMRRSGRNPKWGKLLGFMLLMGGWCVYWLVDVIAISYHVSQLCNNVNVLVYVHPKDFIELRKFNEKNTTINKTIYHNQKKYILYENYFKNSEILKKSNFLVYRAYIYSHKNMIIKKRLLVDRHTDNILLEISGFSTKFEFYPIFSFETINCLNDERNLDNMLSQYLFVLTKGEKNHE